MYNSLNVILRTKHYTHIIPMLNSFSVVNEVAYNRKYKSIINQWEVCFYVAAYEHCLRIDPLASFASLGVGNPPAPSSPTPPSWAWDPRSPASSQPHSPPLVMQPHYLHSLSLSWTWPAVMRNCTRSLLPLRAALWILGIGSPKMLCNATLQFFRRPTGLDGPGSPLDKFFWAQSIESASTSGTLDLSLPFSESQATPHSTPRL